MLNLNPLPKQIRHWSRLKMVSSQWTSRHWTPCNDQWEYSWSSMSWCHSKNQWSLAYRHCGTCISALWDCTCSTPYFQV